MKNRLLYCLMLISFLLAAQEKPYTILISLDGFRWDYMHRGLTPNMDEFRTNGVTATSMQPVFPTKTFPNHLSIVTGMHPENHGIILNFFRNPHTGEIYRLGDDESVRSSKWYQGEAFWETAERNNITCASYFWPGSELPEPHRRSTHRELYDHNRPYEERVEGVIKWLELPKEERPYFITMYFHETDSKGHRHGPESPEVDTAIRLVDSLIGKLRTRLNDIGLADKTNIIIVSDHGMAAVHTDKVVNLENMISAYNCEYTASGPFLLIKPAEKDMEAVFNILKKNEKHYLVRYTKDLPENYHFSNHPFIPPIIAEADLGWSVVDNRGEGSLMRRPGSGGAHGYDKHLLDMHGIFYAIGPSFREGYRTGTVNCLDVYPLLCKIYGIQPRQNIDGKLSRIEFVLK